MKHQNEDFRVRYNVSSAKKRNFELDTTYQAQKRGFFMLPRGAERPKREFSCFRPFGGILVWYNAVMKRKAYGYRVDQYFNLLLLGLHDKTNAIWG